MREPEGINDIIPSFLPSFGIGCLTHPQLSATDGHSLNLSASVLLGNGGLEGVSRMPSPLEIFLNFLQKIVFFQKTL